MLLAVDELNRDPDPGTKNLAHLCEIVDYSLSRGNANDRILLAVSVYNLVDLGEFATGSKRDLVHQELPPSCLCCWTRVWRTACRTG